MHLFYLDEPLEHDDSRFVKEVLVQKEGLASIQEIRQIRVAGVLPTLSVTGQYEEDITDRIELVKAHLLRAGLGSDAEHQVVWTMAANQTRSTSSSSSLPTVGAIAYGSLYWELTLLLLPEIRQAHATTKPRQRG